MPSKHHMNVSETEHLARFVADQVASGRFGPASEVVRAGLRLLEREVAVDPSGNGDVALSGPTTTDATGSSESRGKTP
jgi:hypothetical protein